MTKHVAIYTRVSRDNFGDERSPTRQEADCRAFAAIREWEVIAAYRDVDLSAYVRSVRRPGYAPLLEAASGVLGGETLGSIARDFNTRGIRRAQGGLWVGRALRGILVHPSLAGLRSYEGEIVAKGSWPAILDEVTSARLRLLFADPTRRHLLPSASGTPEPSNPTPTARGRARPPPSDALPLASAASLHCSCARRVPA